MNILQQFSKKLARVGSTVFVRNVLAVATGTAASQAIAVIFTPLITRLYGPEIFGAQSVFLSLANIAAGIAALTYPMAIVLPKEDDEARALSRLSVLVGIIVACSSAVLFWFYGRQLLVLINSESIEKFIFLIPLFTLSSVFSAVLVQWSIRKKAFKLGATTSILQALIVNFVKVAGGFIYASASVLIVTNAIGNLIQAGLLLIGLRRNSSNLPRTRAEESRGLLVLASRYRDFPLLRAPQVLINAASQGLPIILLSSYFGVSAVGLYSIANTVLGVPANLIGGSVVQVFYPRFNDAVRNGENASQLLVKATFWTAVLGIIPFGFVALLGPFLFSVVFGENWIVAGEYGRWLAVWLFCAFINRPAVAAIPVLNLQGSFLIYEILSVVLRIAAVYVGFSIVRNDIVAVAVFSVVGALLNIFLISCVIFFCKEKNNIKFKEDNAL